MTGYNIAIGYKAGFELGCSSSNNPNSNIMIGCCAGQSWNNAAGAGDHNVFIGSKSGCVTSGGCNAAVGMCAGASSGGSHNASLGYKAGYNSWGWYNVNVGWCAGSAGSGHKCNVSVGAGAGKALTYGGDFNTFVGFGAGCNVTTGDHNIAIGQNVQLPSATGDKQFAIGCGTDRWLTGDSDYVVTSGAALEAGTFFQNDTALAANTTFPASGTKNGGVFGPYTINSSVTLTISSGSTFTII